MKNKIRVIQLGCGGRGMVHTAATKQVEGVELVAICDMNQERLQAAVKRFDIKKAYTNFDDMLKNEEFDLVDIITPPTIRVDIVEQAVAGGAKAILIEKPLALKPSEGRRLAELAEGRLIAVNTQYQWMYHWQNFWKLLAEGGLGEIQNIKTSIGVNILEQGSHITDLAMKVARVSELPEPETILAAISGLERFGATPVPSDTLFVVKMGGARLEILAGPSAPLVPNETVKWYHIQVEVIGSEGRLWVSLNQGWKLWLKDGFQAGITDWGKNDGESQRGLVAGLRDAILEGTEALFPTRMQIAEPQFQMFMAAYQSALDDKCLKLPAKVDDTIIERLESLK